MSREKQLEKLLKEKNREKKLHDFYLENPNAKFVWVKKKYSKEDYAAFILSTFFMLIVASLMIYFFKIGFFMPTLVKENQIDVVILDSYSRGEKMIQVMYEPAINKSANNIAKNIKNTLIGTKDNTVVDSKSAPNVSVSLSNNIIVHIDPLGKPFDIAVGWHCENLTKKKGDKVKVMLSLYQRKFDRNNFYKFTLLEDVCEHKVKPVI